MNISVKSEYALRALFDLASQQLASQGQSGATQPIKIADIAKRQKIPAKVSGADPRRIEAKRVRRLEARCGGWLSAGPLAGFHYNR